MLDQFLSNPMLTGILSCLVPTVAFSGINATYFSHRQILFAALFSLVLGLVLGVILFFIPPLFAAALACLVFMFFSEQLLASIFPAIKHRMVFCAIIITLMALSTIYHDMGLLSLNVILIIYLCFSLKDLYTQSQLIKSFAFDTQNFSFMQSDDISDYCSIDLKEKPDIFLLFWESMHGREAIIELYDMDDVPLYEYLKEKNFTVHSNSFSNRANTFESINSIMNMNYIDNHLKNTPNAIQILNFNDYEIQFFDSQLYTFNNYLGYAKFFSFHIPNYVKKLYDIMLPFFMQSKYLMHITKDINPFDDTTSNDNVLKSLTNQLGTNDLKPQCYIVRMGAAHADLKNPWKTRETKWLPKYINIFYPEASLSLRKTIDTILKHRPKALIAITGDHGAACMSGIWNGSKTDLNENIIANGGNPALVSLSLSSILLAIRWPMGELGSDQILSPCNIFRHIFRYLGGKGKILEELENLAFFQRNSSAIFLLAREGRLLKSWIPITNNEIRLHSAQQLLQQESKSPDIQYEIIHLLEKSCQFDAALKNSFKAVNMFPDNLDLCMQLISLLLRTGQALKAEIMCKALLCKMPHDNKALMSFLLILAIQGKKEIALQMLDAKRKYIQNPKKMLSMIFCIAGDKPKALEAAQEYFDSIYKGTVKDDDMEIEHFKALFYLVFQLDEAAQVEQAIHIMNQCYDMPHISIESKKNYHYLLPLFSLHSRNWLESVKKLHLPIFIIRDFSPLFFFWAMGALEQLGKIDHALQIYEEHKELLHSIPNFDIQMGLFSIRNKFNSKECMAYKVLAYEYMKKEMLWLKERNLFDEKWYAEKYADMLQGKEPLIHYLHFRRFLLLDPNPLFNSVFYYFTQIDVLDLGIDPLAHFISCSPFENRNPSIYFDIRAYMAQHPEAARSNINPLVHHLCPEYYSNISA